VALLTIDRNHQLLFSRTEVNLRKQWLNLD